MTGIGLELRLRQHLALTPRLQQSVKLLQLSALEFEQALQQAIAANPFLEDDEVGTPHEADSPSSTGAGDDTVAPADAPAEPDPAREAVDDGLGERYDFSGDRPSGHGDGEEGDWTEWTESAPTLRDHLLAQLLGCRLPPRDRLLATLLIEALDDDGYLKQEFDELARLVPLDPALEPDEFIAPLRLVQSMEPAGVGARSLAECLALQIETLRDPEATPQAERVRKVALRIARDHLGSLARREFARLQQAVGCSEAELRAAHALIRRLDPRPGSRFARPDVRYVVPDVIVRKVKGAWMATINPAVQPNVRVNRRYAELFRRARDGSHGQLAQQLQEARWLVRNTEQRFATILRVAEAIVAHQKNFFEYGDVAMKPLGLRHIAAELGLHESTISRATGNKYMSTPRGMFEFRHFFSRQLATDTGGSCSATAIRALLKEMIAAESRDAPLSDVRLAEMLAAQGVKVARRTVTKYRRLMQVPPVELRRLA